MRQRRQDAVTPPAGGGAPRLSLSPQHSETHRWGRAGGQRGPSGTLRDVVPQQRELTGSVTGRPAPSTARTLKPRVLPPGTPGRKRGTPHPGELLARGQGPLLWPRCSCEGAGLRAPAVCCLPLAEERGLGMTWRGRRRTLGSCAPPRSSSPGAGPCAWALPEDAGLQCGCCRVRPAARADRWQEAEAGGGAAEAPRAWAGSRSARGPRPEVRGGLCLGHAFRSVHKTFCGASRVKGVVDSRSVTGKLGSEPTWPERFPHGGDGFEEDGETARPGCRRGAVAASLGLLRTPTLSPSPTPSPSRTGRCVNDRLLRSAPEFSRDRSYRSRRPGLEQKKDVSAKSK